MSTVPTTVTPAIGDPGRPVPGADSRAEAIEILRRCDELALLSARTDGIERSYLSSEHRAANDLVGQWLREAGMATRVDAAGSICGRIEGRTPGLPALVIGSHLDTVPDAGRYDGILGVLLGVAVAGRLASHAAELPFALEVIGFGEEEGVRFGTTLMASRAFAGTWDPRWWELTDEDGTSLAEAFTAFGLDPARIAEAARAPEHLIGYLEAHIEQGPQLAADDLALGVVTSIAGARRCHLVIEGEARHAGGTPYDRRRDALVGASEAVVAIEEIGRARQVIATVGRLEVTPGAVNVVPGRVELSLDLRAAEDAVREDALVEIEARVGRICADRRLGYELTTVHRADAVTCADGLVEAVTHAIESVQPGRAPRLWSRAGHDAMAVAGVTEVGMIFTRCHDGISHSPDESVRGDDVALALSALTEAVLRLAAVHDS